MNTKSTCVAIFILEHFSCIQKYTMYISQQYFSNLFIKYSQSWRVQRFYLCDSRTVWIPQLNIAIWSKLCINFSIYLI